MATTKLIEYYQGETILFDVLGDAVIDLDANDFTILFYKEGRTPIEIKKSDLTYVSANKYTGEIANTITKDMEIGCYIEEIFLGENNTTILLALAFKILQSSSKKLIP